MNIGEALHDLVKAYQERHPGVGYGDALAALERDQPREVQKYLAESWHAPAGTAADPGDAGGDTLSEEFLEGGRATAESSGCRPATPRSATAPPCGWCYAATAACKGSG